MYAYISLSIPTFVCVYMQVKKINMNIYIWSSVLTPFPPGHGHGLVIVLYPSPPWCGGGVVLLPPPPMWCGGGVVLSPLPLRWCGGDVVLRMYICVRVYMYVYTNIYMCIHVS